MDTKPTKAVGPLRAESPQNAYWTWMCKLNGSPIPHVSSNARRLLRRVQCAVRGESGEPVMSETFRVNPRKLFIGRVCEGRMAVPSNVPAATVEVAGKFSPKSLSDMHPFLALRSRKPSPTGTGAAFVLVPIAQGPQALGLPLQGEGCM